MNVTSPFAPCYSSCYCREPSDLLLEIFRFNEFALYVLIVVDVVSCAWFKFIHVAVALI